MTIAIMSKVPEGVVLGADSTVTIQDDNGKVINTYDNVQKIFPIEQQAAGVITWGLGKIGIENVQSLIMQFEWEIEEKRYKVEDLAHELCAFMKEKYENQFTNAAKRQVLGFIVAGYDKDQTKSQEFVFNLENPKSQPTILRPDINGNPSYGLNWFGQPQWITRLIMGYDGRLFEHIRKKFGLNQHDLKQILKTFEAPIPYDGMPLQDAIELTRLLVELTNIMFKVGVGAPICGGPVDIAVITPDGFCWIQQKQLYSKVEQNSLQVSY